MNTDPTAKISRRQRAAEEKEYHDFIFSMENRAKQVLKEYTKRTVAEAARARVANRKRKNKIPNGVIHQQQNGGGDSSELTVKIPSLTPTNRKKKSPTKSNKLRESTSLPVLNKSNNDNKNESAAQIIARVKNKLAESPLAWTSDAALPQKAAKSAKQRKREEQMRREIELHERVTQRAKHVKVVSNKTFKVSKIMGHFAPGTVAPRAEHAVPRRLVLSEWLNPKKPVSVERGLSQTAMKALTQDNELQGPTNWCSVDLRLKYRDEKQRTMAWQASTERQLEAERLRQDQGMFVPVVVVSRHPVHTDFYSKIQQENRESTIRARGRSQLKSFSYDFAVIWKTNRPANPEELLLENTQETESYPPAFTGVSGLQDRRDKLAHESDNCQVQSVTHERAMRGAFSASNQNSDKYIESVNKKIDAVRKSRVTTVLPQDNGGYFLQKVLRKRDRKWAQNDQPYFRLVMFVKPDGLLLTTPTSSTTPSEEKDPVIVSVYKLEKTKQWAIVAYACNDSSEYQSVLSDDNFQELLNKRKQAHDMEQVQKQKLFHERLALLEKQKLDARRAVREKQRALWWQVIILAAKTANFGVNAKSDDQYATLANYSPAEARACIQYTEKLRHSTEITADLASIVHRQVLQVKILDGPQRVQTGESLPVMVIAAVAAVTHNDPERTAVTLHIRSMRDMSSYAVLFSVKALCNWLTQQNNLVVRNDNPHSENEYLIPPTQLKWWLLNSDWKTQVFREIFKALCFEKREQQLVPFVPGLAIAEAAVQYERLRMIDKEVENVLPKADAVVEPILQELSPEDVMREVLVMSSGKGGLGIVDRVFEVRRRRQRIKQQAERDRCMKVKHDEESSNREELCLALSICGRGPKDENFIGGAPPSTSLKGQFGLVPALHTRDPAISSTNSVTCTLTLALDSPLLAPVVLSFDQNPVCPVATPESQFITLGNTVVAVIPPSVVKRVISKLDFREACTIAVLNPCEVEDDLLSKKKAAATGHRRMDPEMNMYNFRIRFTTRMGEVTIPDSAVSSSVFGITQSAATLNAADTWPHRYTWHSDDMVFSILTRPRQASDYSYVSRKGSTVGSNDPNAYDSKMAVEECVELVRVSRTRLLANHEEMEIRLAQEEKDKVLRARMEAAQASKANSEERRAMLDQELNDKRLKRERQLRGKTAKDNGVMSRLEDWIKRVKEPSTKKLGKWKKWQAYLYLDMQAKEIIVKAAELAEMDQLARIAAGERPKSKRVIAEEAFDLAVKEGTLFYHETVEGVYQWDQPEGWEGVATLPSENPPSTDGADDQYDRPFADKHLLRGDDDGLVEDKVKIEGDYDPAILRKKQELELQEMRKKDAEAALVAAKEVEHSRRLRFVEENVRNWLDTKAAAIGMCGVFDLRSVFRDMDDDKTGLVSYEEFKLALADVGLELPLPDQDTIIKHLDKNEDGVVDYIEFVHWVFNVTFPDSFYNWIEHNFDMPELGPNTWLQMKQRDTLLSVVGLYEEYKDVESGQHYYYSLQTGEFTWLMPQEFQIKSRQIRDSRELRQAQVAASMAAKSAAESAEQAERSAARSMNRIVDRLSESSDFVQMVCEKLGLSDFLKQQEQEKDEKNKEDVSVEVPKLVLKQHRRRDDAEAHCDSGDDMDREEYDSEDDEEGTVVWDVEEKVKKPGQEWRILKPGTLKEGFITKASKPNLRGADMTIYSKNLNRPSLVGVVDPADVAHIPFEDFPAVEVKFVEDVMADTLASTDLSKEQLLDRSEEDQMLEMVQDAFMACKHQHFEKLEEYLDLGVKITECDENGNTLLIIAAQQGSKRLVKFLLRRGADINATNLSGNTALHFAFMYSFEHLSEYMISKGADDSLLNAEGFTCYEMVAKAGGEDI